MAEHDTDEVLHRLAAAYSTIPRQFEVDAQTVKHAVVARRRRRRVGAAVLGVAAVALVGGLSWKQLSPREHSPNHDRLRAGDNSVVVTSIGASERFASSTARDWASGANLVAVVKVTGEVRGPETPAADGSGDRFVERKVSLDVERKLWSAGVGRGIGSREILDVDAPGWLMHADGSTSRLALATQPRLEVGHIYVVALVGAVCESDTAGGTSWSTLGSGGVIPADEGRLGYGESEGRAVSGDVDQATPGSLERSTLGDAPEALIAPLDAAAAGLADSPAASDAHQSCNDF